MTKQKKFPEVQKIVGKRIKQFRKMTRMSQEQFAKRIGMNMKYYSSIEQGRQNITMGNLVKIANGLNVPYFKLFLFDDDKRMEVLVLARLSLLSEEDQKAVAQILGTMARR